MMREEISVDQAEEVRARYEAAIATLLTKVKEDPYVLAVVLVGSLAYDVVWAKSDIDLMLITQETKQKSSGLTLVEEGISIHANLIPRSEFKGMLEGAVQSTFLHSMLMKGQLLFTRDETLAALWEKRAHFGARDREIVLLDTAVLVLLQFTKAQKWLYHKRDPRYSFFWIMKCVDGLATLETVLAGEITGREVVWQALRHNPTFFGAIYTELIDGPKTPETIAAALNRIDAYLKERVALLFQPLLDYLIEAEGIRSAREINYHFQTHMQVRFASMACEWLAEEGYIRQVAVPARLTEKSRVDVEEAAYYYDAL